MDIKSFLKLVNKYKWLLILLPVATVTITYFLVQNLPKQYKSDVQIATGLLDPTKKVISDQTVDLFKVSQEFSSIIEKMKMKTSINKLSYNLIIHDLSDPSKSFTKYSKSVDSLDQQKKQDMIALYKEKLLSKSILILSDDKGKYKLYSIVESMGYGEDALRKKLDISHADNSDFINIEYISENPDLSAYVVNTLATSFIDDYTADVSVNETNSNELLDSLVKQQKKIYDAKTGELAAFKLSHNVINLPEQAAGIDAQIKSLETQKGNLQLTIDQDNAALEYINSELKSTDPDIAGSSRADNRELINLQTQLQTASTNQVDHPSAANRKKIDSITILLNVKRDQNSNENVYNPVATKQNLQSQKQAKVIELRSLNASFKSIDATLTRLRGQFNQMMPYGSEIQAMEIAQTQAEKDYNDALTRYNNSKTIQNVSGFHLEIEQKGLPGNPEPSKRAIYLGGAAFVSFSLCMGFLFILFVLDHSITDMRQLERVTKSRVIGPLNIIQGNERNIRDIWNDKSGNQNYEIYRDLLRSIRFEISNRMDGADKKILGITSLVAGEGKTFIAYSLAYAFAMTGKKILLIADELPVVKSDNKGLAKSQNFDTFLIKKEINTEDLITVLSKSMVQSSLLETQSIKSLQAGFEGLREEFDMIIIDVNSLHNMNIAKEWLLFTEMNVAIFESKKALTENDMEFVKYIKDKPDFIGWILNKIEVKK